MSNLDQYLLLFDNRHISFVLEVGSSPILRALGVRYFVYYYDGHKAKISGGHVHVSHAKPALILGRTTVGEFVHKSGWIAYVFQVVCYNDSTLVDRMAIVFAVGRNNKKVLCN